MPRYVNSQNIRMSNYQLVVGKRYTATRMSSLGFVVTIVFECVKSMDPETDDANQVKILSVSPNHGKYYATLVGEEPPDVGFLINRFFICNLHVFRSTNGTIRFQLLEDC